MTTTIETASSPAALAEFEALAREYLASLPFSLDFQDVDAELADLASTYGPPSGRALIARVDGTAVGCAGIRRLTDGIAELKRMFVRPAARAHGVGRALAEAALSAARELGYERLRLDTTAEMTGAIAVYERLGFAPIAPYRHNPLPGARFFELRLEALPETGRSAPAPRTDPEAPRQ